MYVEDLLIAISDQFDYKHRPFDGILDGEWHRSFITNVTAHVRAEHQLSTNQSLTILKLIAKVRKHLVADGMATDLDISNMLAQPEHRRPLYESLNVPREVRHLGSNLLGFRYKQNDLITKRIKKFCEPQSTEWHDFQFVAPIKPRFDWTYRIWVVPIYRFNLSAILQLINEYRFGLDTMTVQYLTLASNSIDKPSAFTICDDMILGNVCDDIMLAFWITEIADGITL